MNSLYQDDLAYVQQQGFSDFSRQAAPQIVTLLQSSGVATGTILDVGCGAGESTRVFLEAGYKVYALEPSPALASRTRLVADQATIIQSSVFEADLPAADAITAIGEPLTYHRRTSDADAVLREFFVSAGSALRKGGLLVFDLIVTGDAALDARGWRADEDWAVLFDVSEDRANGWLRRTIETFRRVGDAYRRSREVHDVRIFSPDAVTHWLGGAGFSVNSSAVYGTCALAPRRLAFVARKY